MVRLREIIDFVEVAAFALPAMLVDVMIGREPDGAHLLGRLLGEPTTARIPLIICTASVRAASITAAFLSELKVPIVRKRFVIGEVLTILRNTMQDGIV